MKLRYAVAALIILLAGCSASHTGSSTSVLPGAPGFTSQEGVNPLNLNTKNVIHKYALPNANSNPLYMATGSDKNVWFTEQVSPGRIGKITPSGIVTEYAIPSLNTGTDIAPGATGTLWFTENNISAIGKIKTNGTITEYPLPSSHTAYGIVKGPDGNMWFTEPNGDGGPLIGTITPTGTLTEYLVPTGFSPFDIAAGPDDNLWFTGNGVNKITTGGMITEYGGCGQPNAITAGPDGNLYESTPDGICQTTTAGTSTPYTSGGSYNDIILGPDKQMWLSGFSSGSIQEFNPKTQAFSAAITPDPGQQLGGLAVGSDGDVWIADTSGNSILVYEEKVTTIGIRLNDEFSFTDPNYGYELGYAVGTGNQTQTISLSMGESVQFKNLDTIPHSAAFLGDATANNAPWPATFIGSTTKSPAGTAIGTTGWATGSLNPNKTSPIYETGLPGFYMVGDQYDYVDQMMRTVIVVH